MTPARVFATWQRGSVRFLATPGALRVSAQARCGVESRWWHSVGAVGREQLERAAGVGIAVLFRAASRCAWADKRHHHLLLDAARCRELLVALDAALEAGMPPRRKPRALSPPDTSAGASAPRPSGETP